MTLDAIAPAERHFLFLQGLPGPFFRLLGATLRTKGCRVSRVCFNGGDVFDWRQQGARWYRGTPAQWPEWLKRNISDVAVTDIVLFGDCRPAHISARAVAQERGIAVHVFEEGYLRPNHATLELGGVNAYSPLPRTLDALRCIDTVLQPDQNPIHAKFGRRARETIRYAVATIILRPLFPNYKSHRLHPFHLEAMGWISRWMTRKRRRGASALALNALAGKRFFLFPLQLDGDAQLRHHSPFETMKDAVTKVLRSFAEAADVDTHLLIKMHPLDPDLFGWRQQVTAMIAAHGLNGRAVFIERGDLPPLIESAVGVVTVNSTIGPLAMAVGTPVHVLGTAIYDIEGLTAAGSLNAFWRAPTPVNREAFALFARVLTNHALVNGGFHSRDGLRLLIQGSLRKLGVA